MPKELIPGKLYKTSQALTCLYWNIYKKVLLSNDSTNETKFPLYTSIDKNDIIMFTSYVSHKDFYELKLFKRGFSNSNIPIILSMKNNNIIMPCISDSEQYFSILE